MPVCLASDPTPGISGQLWILHISCIPYYVPVQVKLLRRCVMELFGFGLSEKQVRVDKMVRYQVIITTTTSSYVAIIIHPNTTPRIKYSCSY